MAPEAFLGLHYTEKVDVYSFGHLLYEVCCLNENYVPFISLNFKHPLQNNDLMANY